MPSSISPEEKKSRVLGHLDDYPKNRILAIDQVTEAFGMGKTLSPDEDATVKANHRKAVEDIVREIRKNPEGAVAGPKPPARKVVVKDPPAL